MPKPITKANQAKIRTWLKGKGHKPDAVDSLRLNDDDDVRKSLCEVHGVTAEQYRMAAGR